MLAGTVSEQYRALVEILTCPVCDDLVNQAHICPNCSKFYCLGCIYRQLRVEEKCLNCNRFLNVQMLSNCQKLCAELTQTLSKVQQRGSKSNRMSNDKSPYYCYRHKLEKTYYCQTCDRPLCSDCSVLTDTHRGHQFIKLSIIKTDFKHKMSQKLEEIKTFSQNLQRKVKMLNEGSSSEVKWENDSFSKVQTSMKSLRQHLKRKLKRTINEGQKKLDQYIESIEQWNTTYEQGMNILKNTTKGKFVERQYIRLEQKLLKQISNMNIIEKDMLETNIDIKNKNVGINYINPEFYNFIFIIQNFKEKRKEQEYFYTQIVTTKEGLQLRLKIYPKGIPEQPQDDSVEIKMKKRVSKNEDYISIFIQLVDGPVTNTKQKHELILNSHIYQGKNFVRQFESEFDVGVCWGYDHFIKTSQLYEEGYYNQEFDFIEIILKIGPCTYHQATKDQLAFIKMKQNTIKSKKEHIAELHKLLGRNQAGSTSSIIQDDEQF